ncbi:MAG: hypothetical protein RR404_03150 [Bacilli bacterium]
MIKRKISFPHFGNYSVPFGYFIKNVFDADFQPAPPITKRTLELGSINSPDFVCSPFKYNLGNYIEALEQGADTLIQIGGVCRLGYYGELQEQILRDLGYNFDFINLSSMNIHNPKSVWSELKRFNKKLSLKNVSKTIFICMEMVEEMDFLEKYIRKNVGFEIIIGSLDILYKEYLTKISQITTRKQLKKIYKEYLNKIEKVKLNKPKNLLKVGIVGEYYTIMEPFSNHFLERELASKGIYVTRNIDVSSTIFHRKIPKILKKISKYVKYDIGATGIDTVNSALLMAKKGYDGIIHVKSFGCTPEIDTMTILQNISQDYKIPIIYFSFDSQTSETGIKTRLEAFNDMIVMRKERK